MIFGGGGGGIGLDGAENAREGYSGFGSWSSAYIKFGCSVSLGLF